jgi:hypothetical protein
MGKKKRNKIKKKKKPMTRAQKILQEAREKRMVIQEEQRAEIQNKLKDQGFETLYKAEEDPEMEYKIRESWTYKFDEVGYRVYYNTVSKEETYTKPDAYDDRDVKYPTASDHLIDDLFAFFDRDNQGFLTRKDLEALMEAESLPGIPRKLHMMMSLYDLNKDDKLQLNEWQFMMNEHHNLSPDQFYTYTDQYGLPDKYYYYNKGGKEGDPRHPEQMNEEWGLEEDIASDDDTPARKGERRYDPSDGQLYTKLEFRECYGGLDEWNNAAPEAQEEKGEKSEEVQKKALTPKQIKAAKKAAKRLKKQKKRERKAQKKAKKEKKGKKDKKKKKKDKKGKTDNNG